MYLKKSPSETPPATFSSLLLQMFFGEKEVEGKGVRTAFQEQHTMPFQEPDKTLVKRDFLGCSSVNNLSDKQPKPIVKMVAKSHFEAAVPVGPLASGRLLPVGVP